METAIAVQHFSKTFISHSPKYQTVEALKDVSLTVGQGEILGILGPNGAGKTTFLNILSTLLLPDRGTFNILGLEGCPKNFAKLRRLINLSSGYPNYPWSLTVREILNFYGRLYGLRSRSLRQKIDELVQKFDLEKIADRRFDEISSGNKQRLSLAKAFLNNPRVLFLDEPTIGLDPGAAAAARKIIMNLIGNPHITVLLTTHNMMEAETMCRRIAFIKNGRIIRLSSPQELKKMHGKTNLEEVFVDLARPNGEQSDKSYVIEEKPIRPLPMAALPSPAAVADLPVRDEIINWFNRCLAFAYRNFLFATRNFFAFAEMIFWPVVTLVSVGLMGHYLELGTDNISFILTGAVAGGILQVAQLDVSYSLLYEVWSKSVKHTYLAPVGLSENLFGSWVIGILRGLGVFLILGLLSLWFFDFRFPSLGVTILFLMGILGCALLLGILVSFLILVFGQKAEITAWMFAYLFMLVSGIYYPVSIFPPSFYYLAQWIPITYFLDFYRGYLGFPVEFPLALVKGFGLVIFYLGAGLVLLKHALHAARRKGTLLRLSE